MKIKHVVGTFAGLSLLVAACGGDDGASVTDLGADEDGSGSASESGTGSASEPGSGDEGDASGSASEPGSGDEGDASGSASGPVAGDPTSGDEGAIPTAIVSLSPTATEMLYAIGAGDQVIAVDDFSNHPAEAAEKMAGISGFEPNVEAIAGLEPDLVVTDGTNPDFLAQLDDLGIARWEGPAAATFDDVYSQIEQLGAATGHVGEAAELVGQMQTDVAAVIAGLPELDQPLTYYHELDPSLFSVTSETFIGAVYGEIGLENIADEAGADSLFPQLNAEFVVEQDPDLIFLACTIYCGTTADEVAERDGWENMTAVTSGGVIEMNDDIASRWGPRIVDYLEAAGDAVAEVVASQPVG